MASVSYPPPAGRRVDQKEHRGGSENSKAHQSAGREMGKNKAAGDGQARKQELHYYQRQVDQRLSLPG